MAGPRLLALTARMTASSTGAVSISPRQAPATSAARRGTVSGRSSVRVMLSSAGVSAGRSGIRRATAGGADQMDRIACQTDLAGWADLAGLSGRADWATRYAT